MKQALVILTLLKLSAGAALADSYTFTSIVYPGSSETWAYGLNDSGNVVGMYWGGGAWHGFTKGGNGYTSFDYVRGGELYRPRHE